MRLASTTQLQIKQFGTEQKQAGNGPNWRHIQGSKIAKGLPRVNVQSSKIEKAKTMDRVAAGAR